MIAFVVLSYNEADTIERTLNSIKYQIDNYGAGRDIQLIIADDCSKDGTRDIAEKWIDDNKNLFKLVNILPAESNVGTCKNIANAFRALRTEYFLVIAGDDVISKQNVFRKMDMLDECDMLLSSVLCFRASDLSIIRNERKCLNTVIQCCESSKYIRFISGVACPIQNGAIYRTSLLTDEVLEYMEKYRLLDDRPRYYAMFRDKNQNIRVKYDNEPIILYGSSDNSVTSPNSGSFKIVSVDLNDFYMDQYNKSDNFIVKCYLKYKLIINNYRTNKVLYNLDPYFLAKGFLYICNRGKIRRNIKELLLKYADENEMYLKSL